MTDLAVKHLDNDGWSVREWMGWWAHWAWFQGYMEANSLRQYGKVVGRPWRHWLEDVKGLHGD